ncbi:hypothetical protein [Moorena sp. SIO3H5]|uniref:hypothetical protein n=1 Tax=Moorena sp. SIO3H5 TaxID=2607834 RepID=UPI0013BCF767|nr:hypothetical protein [Moorena sp. SIO3H5]NEO72160.1 hypothetical protein [Moorena sp. SIO3H5]
MREWANARMRESGIGNRESGKTGECGKCGEFGECGKCGEFGEILMKGNYLDMISDVQLAPQDSNGAFLVNSSSLLPTPYSLLPTPYSQQ